MIEMNLGAVVLRCVETSSGRIVGYTKIEESI